MNDTVISAVYGGLAGALISSIISLIVAKNNRQFSYYENLVKLFEAHNWRILEHKLDSGLNVRTENNEIAVVCYQHLNLLFFVWLNRKTARKDGSLEGWKNWAEEIIQGASKTNRIQFRNCYRQILNHGDLYPKKFIYWLDEELSISAKKFPESTD